MIERNVHGWPPTELAGAALDLPGGAAGQGTRIVGTIEDSRTRSTAKLLGRPDLLGDLQ